MPISNIKNFIDGLLAIKTDNKDGAFLSSKISQLVSLFMPKLNLYDKIGNNIIGEFLRNNYIDIDDCFLVAKTLKTGTDNLLRLYDKHTDDTKRFIDVSHIDETLKLELSYIPEFYVYIKPKKQLDSQTINGLRKQIGSLIAEETKKFIDKNFMGYLQSNYTDV